MLLPGPWAGVDGLKHRMYPCARLGPNEQAVQSGAQILTSSFRCRWVVWLLNIHY